MDAVADIEPVIYELLELVASRRGCSAEDLLGTPVERDLREEVLWALAQAVAMPLRRSAPAGAFSEHERPTREHDVHTLGPPATPSEPEPEIELGDWDADRKTPVQHVDARAADAQARATMPAPSPTRRAFPPPPPIPPEATRRKR